MSNGSININDIEYPQSMINLDRVLSAYKSYMANKSRTAKHWLQYLQYIDILKSVIRAERTCDWNLHLVGVSKMLNLFAATGHNNYAKCARLYLQLMHELPDKHPWINNIFYSGFHAVRRSDKYWAGLSTDLAIEQVMMRAVKSKGGLTHGRGMDESVRAVWVHSLHKCAGVHAFVNSLVGLDVTSGGDTHVDLGKSRVSRDFQDLGKMLTFLEIQNPFDVSDSSLRCISNGMIAADADNINCDMSEEVGLKIMLRMNDVSFTEAVP